MVPLPANCASNISTSRASSSSALPSRAALYAVTPFFLIAEYAGGSCFALPTSDESVCRGSSLSSTASPSPGALEENCVTTRPSASSVSVATPKTKRAEYALSWPVR